MHGRREAAYWSSGTIREAALGTERRGVAGRVNVVDVLDQVGVEEERVDLVLMFGRLGELVLLVGVCASKFVGSSLANATFPSRPAERLLGCEDVVDDRVRSGQRSVDAGDDVLLVKSAKLNTLLVARRSAADADYALIFQFVVIRGYFG